MNLDEALEEHRMFIAHQAAYDWVHSQMAQAYWRADQIKCEYGLFTGLLMATSFLAVSTKQIAMLVVALREAGQL